MDIYAILKSCEHNIHYVKRYVNFIQSRTLRPVPIVVEKHHICPKSLFPHFSNLRQNPWNQCLLSPREHFIAHWLLSKAIASRETILAFATMAHRKEVRVSSKNYEKAKMISSANMSLMMKGRHSGKIYVKKDSECKRIDPSQLADYISDGWTKGMVRKVPPRLGTKTSKTARLNMSRAQLATANHSTRGKKRPDHSEFMRRWNE